MKQSGELPIPQANTEGTMSAVGLSSNYLHVLPHDLSVQVGQALQWVQAALSHPAVLADPPHQRLLEDHVVLATLEYHAGLALPAQRNHVTVKCTYIIHSIQVSLNTYVRMYVHSSFI